MCISEPPVTAGSLAGDAYYNKWKICLRAHPIFSKLATILLPSGFALQAHNFSSIHIYAFTFPPQRFIRDDPFHAIAYPAYMYSYTVYMCGNVFFYFHAFIYCIYILWYRITNTFFYSFFCYYYHKSIIY